MTEEEQKEKTKLAQAEMGDGMKALMADHIMPTTFAWAVAKRRLMQDVARRYGGRVTYHGLSWKKEYQNNKFFVFIKSYIGFHLSWFFRKYWMIQFVSRVGKLSKVFAPQWYYMMDGHHFYIDEKDWRMIEITRDYTMKKIWEPETTKIVKEHVKKAQTVIDIGASVGYFSLLFARLVGEKGRVFAFEPTDGNFKYLLHNIKKNGYKNIKAHQLAAWDKSEMVYVMPHSSTRKWATGVALDDFLELRGIRQVDFIKIDVDGADLNVLRGLIRTFERSSNLKMVCEFYPKYLQMFGADPNEFIALLGKYFDYSIIEDDYEEIGQDHCNFYCVRKEHVV